MAAAESDQMARLLETQNAQALTMAAMQAEATQQRTRIDNLQEQVEDQQDVIDRQDQTIERQAATLRRIENREGWLAAQLDRALNFILSHNERNWMADAAAGVGVIIFVEALLVRLGSDAGTLAGLGLGAAAWPIAIGVGVLGLGYFAWRNNFLGLRSWATRVWNHRRQPSIADPERAPGNAAVGDGDINFGNTDEVRRIASQLSTVPQAAVAVAVAAADAEGGGHAEGASLIGRTGADSSARRRRGSRRPA